MRPSNSTFVVGVLLTALLTSSSEAGEAGRVYASPGWRSSSAAKYRAHARWAPPVVTIVTPDLGPPIAPYTYNRLDDGYTYPIGYGEYALYGRWAFYPDGRPVVARCRLVWLDGPRPRSLNRCE